LGFGAAWFAALANDGSRKSVSRFSGAAVRVRGVWRLTKAGGLPRRLAVLPQSRRIVFFFKAG
jgi:hypothetical protein